MCIENMCMYCWFFVFMYTFVCKFLFWVVFLFDPKVVEDVTDFSNLVFLILILFPSCFLCFCCWDEAAL